MSRLPDTEDNSEMHLGEGSLGHEHLLSSHDLLNCMTTYAFLNTSAVELLYSKV